jgi:tripartite-type tricarboxylate transporter receptor subunit TctC
LRGGGTRLLAVSAPARLPTWPEAPTFAEAGFPELTASEAFCLVLPAATPAPIVAALHRAVHAAIARPELRERLARLEVAPLVLDPAATAARIRAEFDAWGPVVRASGFTAEE